MTAVDYPLRVDVAMGGLHTHLVRNTSVAGVSGHRGSICEANDASYCIMMRKVSTHDC